MDDYKFDKYTETTLDTWFSDCDHVAPGVMESLTPIMEKYRNPETKYVLYRCLKCRGKQISDDTILYDIHIGFSFDKRIASMYGGEIIKCKFNLQMSLVGRHQIANFRSGYDRSRGGVT